ncbi:MAG: hypothetical protein H0T44_01830 [Gemmatimonadales bacterium]|nr:hypothetical protein [Gemmatimonadales bacterium]
MKLTLLLPDGFGVRDFLLGSFARAAVERAGLSVFHRIPDHQLPRIAGHCPPAVEWHRLAGGQRGRLEATLGVGLLERWRAHAIARDPGVARCRYLLRKIGPQVLLSSRQSSVEAAAPVAAARELGIPTATFIAGWESLRSGDPFAAPFDHFLVWSEAMAMELLSLHPKILRHQVHAVGAPHFDSYAEPSLLWSREDFCRRIGADSRRPLICYSGGHRETSPEDAGHVRLLLELIRQGRLIGRPQLLLRPAPDDDGRRYHAVRYEFPELLYAAPLWLPSGNSGGMPIVPWPEEVSFLANLTHHCDLAVGAGSALTLDFVMHDKPVVHVAFGGAAGPPDGELGAVRVVRSDVELAAQVNGYLADRTLDREGRRRLLGSRLRLPLGRASVRALETLQRIGAAPRLRRPA